MLGLLAEKCNLAVERGYTMGEGTRGARTVLWEGTVRWRTVEIETEGELSLACFVSALPPLQLQ